MAQNLKPLKVCLVLGVLVSLCFAVVIKIGELDGPSLLDIFFLITAFTCISYAAYLFFTDFKKNKGEEITKPMIIISLIPVFIIPLYYAVGMLMIRIAGLFRLWTESEDASFFPLIAILWIWRLMIFVGLIIIGGKLYVSNHRRLGIAYMVFGGGLTFIF